MKLSSKPGLTGTTFYYLALRLKSLARNFFLFWGRSDLPPPASKPNGFKKFVVHNLFSRRVAFGRESLNNPKRSIFSWSKMRTMTPAIIFVACLGKSSSIPFIIGCNHNRSPDLGVAHSTKRDPSFLIRTEFQSCLRVFSLVVSVFLSSAHQVICFGFLFGNKLVKVIILGFCMLVDMQITA